MKNRAIKQTETAHLSEIYSIQDHRLNGSSSPVLTATCLSYGRLCDFLTFFPQPTWRSHPSTDFDAKWLKRRGFTNTYAFWGKNCNFLKLLTLRPPKPPKFAQFWSEQNFRSISRLTLGVSRVNTPYFSSEPNKSVIVNRQCGGGKFKYVPKFCKGG